VQLHSRPMRAFPLQSVLLAAVLVLGQWLSFAHNREHNSLNPVAEQSCVFCLHAPGLGAGLAKLPKFTVPACAHEAPVPCVDAAEIIAAPSYYSIRGPPALLA